MTNLRPVAKPDKNGKIVTRHMRAEQQDTPSRTLPSPLGTTVNMNQRVAEYKAHLIDTLKSRNVGMFQRRKLMRTLHPDTIPVLLEHNLNQTGKIPSGYVQCCEELGTFMPLNSFAAYLQDGGKEFRTVENTHENYNTLLYLLGLSECSEETPIPPQHAFTPYVEASPEERAVQRKIIEATHELGLAYRTTGKHIGVYPKVLSSYPIIDYIRNNADKSEAVVRLIKDRNINAEDTAGIETLLIAMDETTTPLRDGIL